MVTDVKKCPFDSCFTEMIDNFIQFYQIYFPTSKMLILASHVVPLLKTWCIGFGFLAREQGIETFRVFGY